MLFHSTAHLCAHVLRLQKKFKSLKKETVYFSKFHCRGLHFSKQKQVLCDLWMPFGMSCNGAHQRGGDPMHRRGCGGVPYATANVPYIGQSNMTQYKYFNRQTDYKSSIEKSLPSNHLKKMVFLLAWPSQASSSWGVPDMGNQSPSSHHIIEPLDWQDHPDQYIMVLEHTSPCMDMHRFWQHYDSLFSEEMTRDWCCCHLLRPWSSNCLISAVGTFWKACPITPTMVCIIFQTCSFGPVAPCPN